MRDAILGNPFDRHDSQPTRLEINFLTSRAAHRPPEAGGRPELGLRSSVLHRAQESPDRQHVQESGSSSGSQDIGLI